MIGIDIDEVERFDSSSQFLNRIAFEEEIKHIEKAKCDSLKQQRVASLFSVKEAVMKALGLGKTSGVSFKDIKMLHDESGKPFVELYGIAQIALQEKFAGKSVHISLSHTPTTVVAVAVIV